MINERRKINKNHKDKRRPENAQLRRTIDKVLDEGTDFLNKHLQELQISDYKYNISLAVEELDLDEHLVYQLIEDYIIQILKSKITFYELIKKLKQAEFENLPLDYEELRNLAHKNLGVARNLRIEDAQKILSVLMKNDDLDYLRICVKALEVSAFRLIPLCAYETLNLIKVKNSL